MMQRFESTWCTAAALVVVLAGPSRADLDVALPPGTPLEWRYELPFRVPDGHRGPVYTHTSPAALRRSVESDDAIPRGRTIVVPPKEAKVEAPRTAPLSGNFDPMGAARVLTMDITGHLAWTRRSRSDVVPGDDDYPPSVRADLYWLILTAFLRPMMHAAKVSDAETTQYLVTIGPPVLEVIEHSGQGLGAAAELVEYLRRNIPPVPAESPDPAVLGRGMEDPEQRMLVAWCARELVSDHPYSFNPLYARRTRSLGGEAVPVLVSLARSSHHLLRQNAALLLGSFDAYAPEVVEELRRLAGEADPVSRNRALEGLIRVRDTEAEKLLIRAMGSKDRSYGIFAVQALGRMGSSKARPKILDVLRASPRDHGEAWLAAITALARVGDPDGKSSRALKKILPVLARIAKALDPPRGPLVPDVADQAGDRARLLVEAVTIALARLGDEPSRAQILRWVEVGAAAPADAPRRDTRRLAFDPVLGSIEPSNQLIAIEAVAAMGEKGRDTLKKVVLESTDNLLRGYALRHLARGEGAVDFIAKVAEGEVPSVIRVEAMDALARAEATRGAAVDVAKRTVARYLDDAARVAQRPLLRRATSRERLPAYECLRALRLLGAHEPPTVAQLTEVIGAARERGDFERIIGSQSEPGAPGRGPGGPGRVAQLTLRAFPALYETAVAELGRLADPRAFEVLERILGDVSGPGRAEAALGLGNLPYRESADLLIATLDDKDAWVRYSAYRALRNLSGEDHFADWLFGSPDDRREAVAAWKIWRRDAGEGLQHVPGENVEGTPPEPRDRRFR